MSKGAGSSPVGEGRFWSSPRAILLVVAMFAALVVTQPAGASRTETDPVMAEDDSGGALTAGVDADQLLAPFTALICQSLRQFQAALAGLPAVAPVFAQLLQQFGCTTPTTVGPGTTFLTTTIPPSTITTLPGTPTSSTSSTTLPPCPSTTLPNPTTSSTVVAPTTIP